MASKPRWFNTNFIPFICNVCHAAMLCKRYVIYICEEIVNSTVFPIAGNYGHIRTRVWTRDDDRRVVRRGDLHDGR